MRRNKFHIREWTPCREFVFHESLIESHSTYLLGFAKAEITGVRRVLDPLGLIIDDFKPYIDATHG